MSDDGNSEEVEAATGGRRSKLRCEGRTPGWCSGNDEGKRQEAKWRSQERELNRIRVR